MAKKGLMGRLMNPFRRIVKAVNSTVKNSIKRVNSVRRRVVKGTNKTLRRFTRKARK
jgi:hypothetical protein